MVDDEEDHPHNCTFHTLLESLVGMKFSVDAHEDVPVISVIHESMGICYLFQSTKEFESILNIPFVF